MIYLQYLVHEGKDFKVLPANWQYANSNMSTPNHRSLQHHYLQHNQAFFSISSASWQLEWNNYRTNISHLAGKLAWTEWKSPLSCHWPNTELHRLIWIEGRWCSRWCRWSGYEQWGITEALFTAVSAFVTTLHIPRLLLSSEVHPFITFTPVWRCVGAEVTISKVTFGNK